MGFLFMILNYIINGKFSVLFHDIILLGLLQLVCFFSLFFLLFVFPKSNFILFNPCAVVFKVQTDLSGPFSCFATL